MKFFVSVAVMLARLLGFEGLVCGACFPRCAL
jgi:hypothetical protein